jgi:hypothetical protein
MIQALMMMNGPELNSQVSKGDTSSVVRRAVLRHRNADAILDELFMTTLCRHPSQTELDKIKRTANGGLVVETKTPAEKPKAGETKPAEKPKPAETKPAEKPKAGEKPGGEKPKSGEKPKAAPPASKKPAGTPTPVAGFGPMTDVVAFYQDVYWALLNTAEFMLNH